MERTRLLSDDSLSGIPLETFHKADTRSSRGSHSSSSSSSRKHRDHDHDRRERRHRRTMPAIVLPKEHEHRFVYHNPKTGYVCIVEFVYKDEHEEQERFFRKTVYDGERIYSTCTRDWTETPESIIVSRGDNGYDITIRFSPGENYTFPYDSDSEDEDPVNERTERSLENIYSFAEALRYQEFLARHIMGLDLEPITVTRSMPPESRPELPLPQQNYLYPPLRPTPPAYDAPSAPPAYSEGYR